MLPSTSERVRNNTNKRVSRAIDDQLRVSISWHASHPAHIRSRIEELDEEWDIERALEANASILAFTGTILALIHDRRWLIVPGAVTAFLFQHAIQGWCPPLPLLRRLGFRTSYEIDMERMALKALRGDFEGFSKDKNKPKALFKAVHH